jgi:glycosyltransferase involved in cell wall biosynthesis
MKRIVFFTNYFPKLPSFESFGTWAMDQAKAVAMNNNVLVVSFVPYFPPFLKILGPKFDKWGNVYREFMINDRLNIRYLRVNPVLFKYFKRFKTNPDLFSGYFYGKMKKSVLEFNPDLIIANHVMLEGYIARMFSLKNDIPYVCFEHSPDDFIPLNQKHSEAYRNTVEDSMAFINVSQYSFDLINKIYTFKNINSLVLYNYSQDAMKFRNGIILERYPVNSSKKHIIEVANFENRKNHLALLKIFNKIKDKFADWNVIFAGTHDQTIGMLQEYVRSNGLDDRVQFFRDMKHADVLNLLNFTDIFVLPSESEMFSVSVIEALSAGLPVISTVHNGLTDACFADSPVINVDPADPDQLERNLTMLMSDENLRKKYGAGCRSLYEKSFTEKIYSENIGSLIDSL